MRLETTDMCRRAAALLVVIAAAACGDDGDDGGLPSEPEAQPAPPVRLAFESEPADVPLDAALPAVTIAIQDSTGETVSDATAAITLSLAQNPGNATLTGTTTRTATDGVATFDDLIVERPGQGYTLSASAAGLDGAESASFEIRFALSFIDAGVEHVCGLTAGGRGYCWGVNERGQAGDGELGNRTRPSAVSGGLRFNSIAAGDFHTCAVTVDGKAYCWGWDTNGQRGDGNVGTESTVAVPVPVLGGLTFASVVTGDSHSCALTATSAAHCWGRNSSGALGDGESGTDRGEPVTVQGGLAFESLVAGASHTCGLSADGSAHCWGNNFSGQLGDGNGGTPADTPVAVAGDLEFTALGAGSSSFHQCGLTGDGQAHCWGANDDGELGDGNAGVDSDVPVPVQGDLSFNTIVQGGSHTCALTGDGAAHCWGRNDVGQLGDGNMGTSSGEPVAVAGGHSFTGITPGDLFTCGWTAEGAVYCWGYNADGQLGNGEEDVHRDVPVRVLDP